mgnify:FL=1
MSDPRILVVDDDADIRTLVRDLLERNHMDVAVGRSVAEAEKHLAEESVDLIVLDVMMPGEDGTSFCQRLRLESDIPILMLSALGSDVDRILGLELGADDYLPKPFNPRELVTRIRTILRRAPPLKPGDIRRKAVCYAFDGFELYPETRSLRSGEDEINLTSGEFALLLALVEHAPRILSRDQLLEYSRGAAANPFDRSIDTHISRLRGKLEPDSRRSSLIKTVRNMGYAFTAPVAKTRQ